MRGCVFMSTRLPGHTPARLWSMSRAVPDPCSASNAHTCVRSMSLGVKCPNTGFSHLENLRSHCTDVPLMYKLLQAARIEPEPSKADIFIVPFLMGCNAMLGWGHGMQRVNAKAHHAFFGDFPRFARENLPHFARYPHRHLFLFPLDSMFAPKWLRGSMLAHTGSGYISSERLDVPVPYLVSLPSTAIATASPNADTRTNLVFLMASPSRNQVRVEVARQLREAAAKQPKRGGGGAETRGGGGLGRLLRRFNVGGGGGESAPSAGASSRSISSSPAGGVDEDDGGKHGEEGVRGTRIELYETDPRKENAMPLSAQETMARMRDSTFCVAPTGDSDGFTQRFYYILAAGCIPVRIDTYYPKLSFGRVAWPSKQTINWRRAVVLLPPDRLKRDGLLPTLANISDAQISRMREYISRVVRPHVLFDYRGRSPDAFSAFLDELLHLSKTKLPRLDQRKGTPS